MGITDAAAPSVPRRSDAGHARLTARDAAGLLLCAEHYAAPYDLLAAALGAQPARLRGITARPPALARLAHVRAVLAARLWLESAPAYGEVHGAWLAGGVGVQGLSGG